MSPAAEFFEELRRRGHEALLRRVSATIRFDTTDEGETLHRLVTIDHGDLAVSDDDRAADGIFRCSKAEFDDLVNGRTNPMASLLRGALTVEGDPELLVLAQRLFSCIPVDALGPRRASEGGQAP